MDITVELVKRLLKEQFPQWQGLEVYAVAKSGHDNRTFHLGDSMAVRLPSGAAYAGQIEKESRWLPYLQEHLDYPVAKPLAVGKATAYYPFPWSVNLWVAGETVWECGNTIEKTQFAKDLACALRRLQQIDCQGGPKAGIQNFYRGGDLHVYHRQTKDALEHLKTRLPVTLLHTVWEQSIASVYTGQPVWVHGDIAPGNILVQNNRFYGLIDFGILGVGDPACDYAMAWSYFDAASRNVFLEGLPCDMVYRARGWALWKSLITYDDTSADVKRYARRTVDAILNELQSD